MTDCIVGGLTEEEARQEVIAYFDLLYTLPHDVIYPNQKTPDIENRSLPFIVLNIEDIKREQAGMGSRDYNTQKFLDIELWIREYTGVKEISIFHDFVNSLGLDTINGVVYGVPESTGQRSFKGWELTPVALPFKF